MLLLMCVCLSSVCSACVCNVPPLYQCKRERGREREDRAAASGAAAAATQTRQRPLSGSIWLVSQARAN